MFRKIRQVRGELLLPILLDDFWSKFSPVFPFALCGRASSDIRDHFSIIGNEDLELSGTYFKHEYSTSSRSWKVSNAVGNGSTSDVVITVIKTVEIVSSTERCTDISRRDCCRVTIITVVLFLPTMSRNLCNFSRKHVVYSRLFGCNTNWNHMVGS